MDKQEYIAQVLAQLPGLLEKEKKAVERELLDHLEDRMEPLLALKGVDEAEAERRSVAAMGDPVETGKALKQQYPLRWLILQDVASFVIVVLVLVMFIFGAYNLEGGLKNIFVRFAPSQTDERVSPAWMKPVDPRMEIGDDVVRVYEAGVRSGMAELYLCVYDRVPGGIVQGMSSALTVEDQRGKKWTAQRDDPASYTVEYYQVYLPIQVEDTHVTLCYERYGERIALEIPLPEVTA